MTAGALQEFCWPLSRLGEALAALGRKTQLAAKPSNECEVLENPHYATDEAITPWIRTAAASLGFEAEPAEVNYGESEAFLKHAGPALLRFTEMGEAYFLALLGRRRGSMLVLGPDRRTHKLSLSLIHRAFCEATEGPVRPTVERVLEVAGLAHTRERKRAQIRSRLLGELLKTATITDLWVLRLSPGAPFFSQIRKVGLLGTLTALGSVYSIQYLLGILGWWIIGIAMLQGRFDRPWFIAWAFLLLTILPVQALVTWYQGLVAIGAGGLLKRRLLYGTLRLEPEEIRQYGAGQLLGRVVESEAVESLALNAGFMGLLAGIELLVAFAVLAIGAGGRVQVLLLAIWIAVTARIGWTYWNRRREWTDARLKMTHDLVEKMIGHRTRLAQESAAHWHEEEDPDLDRYLELSHRMDRSEVLIAAVVPHGWLLLGVLGLAPAFLSGTSSPASLAISLGAILLASQALQKLSLGFSTVAAAAIAWRQISPIFRAAARPVLSGSPAFASAGVRDESRNNQPILEAHDLVFSHSDRSEPVLRGLSLSIRPGDHLLLEGPSGSGKSTLAALLSCLRFPKSGVILLRGLDWKTMGVQGWRKHVAMAPQFHENHVWNETLAFNLLMGRCWPPKPEDLVLAETVCRELGLGDLLDRMPGGLSQIVGESGWQLSHGERSRVFVARALLQDADLVILDESFAALDPENLLKAMNCAVQRAGSLLVIAHP